MLKFRARKGGCRSGVFLPKYVIRRLSNPVKIYFEYHTVLKTVKRTEQVSGIEAHL